MLDDFRPDMRWGRELTTTHSLPTIYVDAYIAATQLKIEDDTQIVLKYPNKFLFLIAKEIQVGKDVTITWDRSLNNAPDPPNPPEKRPTAATPIRDDERTPGLWGVAGEMGLMERKVTRMIQHAQLRHIPQKSGYSSIPLVVLFLLLVKFLCVCMRLQPMCILLVDA